MRHWSTERGAYRNQFACPFCKGMNTGTTIIATSERFIRFYCSDCVKGTQQGFAVRASVISSLSRRLRMLIKEL